MPTFRELCRISGFSDSLDGFEFGDRLECSRGSHASNRSAVVTAAHDAKVDKLVHRDIQLLQCNRQVNLNDGLGFFPRLSSSASALQRGEEVFYHSRGAKG